MTRQPLKPSPPQRGLSYLHVSHCTFAVSDGSAILLIDPFLSGRFTWQGKTERHLDKPALDVQQLAPCDAILVSHEHGDHYDPTTLKKLLNRNEAKVYAPQMVVDDAIAQGIGRSRLVTVHPGQQITVGTMTVTAYPSAASENVKPVDRVGFEIESGGVRLFHQGDSHGASPTWEPMRRKLDALIMWPHRVLEVALQIQPRCIIFHHLDRFKPGNFFCNRSPRLELNYHRHYHPDIKFVVPPRGRWQAVRSK